MTICRVYRWMRWLAVTAGASARTRSSLIAVSRVRRSCRYRRTGRPANRSTSTCCQSARGGILFATGRIRVLPATVLAEALPRRFARQWCKAMGAMQPVDQMSGKALRALAKALLEWQVKPCGTSGYAKAEVTLGGVDTDELSSRTMKAKRVPGLSSAI